MIITLLLRVLNAAESDLLSFTPDGKCELRTTDIKNGHTMTFLGKPFNNAIVTQPCATTRIDFNHLISGNTTPPHQQFSIITDSNHIFRITGLINNSSTNLLTINGNTGVISNSTGSNYVTEAQVDEIVANAIQAGQSGGSDITTSEIVEVIRNLDSRLLAVTSLLEGF